MKRSQNSTSGLDRRELLKLSLGAFGLGALGVGGGTARAQTLQRQQSKLAEVLDRGTLLVGTGSTNPPWHFEDDKGNLVGMDIDMGRLVAMGLFNDASKVQFTRLASDARIPSLLTNKVDVIFQFMTVNALRAQQVEFTIPYYREGVGLLMNKSGKYKNFKALVSAGGSARISVLQNVGADDMVHAALPKAQIVQLDAQATVIQAVDSGRADAAAIDQSTSRWLTVRFPQKYIDSGYGWWPQSYSAAVRSGDPIWLHFLNTVLHEAMTGVSFEDYKASFLKWFGVKLPEPAIGFPVEFK
jgi:polar amino acid transport system substrate-binding protein